MSDWYEQHIEPEVREVVRALRNNGINTTCSCGHEMYIECQTLDQNTELSTIYCVMIELGIEFYHVEILAVHAGKLQWNKFMRIEIHEGWEETLVASGRMAKTEDKETPDGT